MDDLKTLEELVDKELKDQLNDISALDTGTPEKTEAIKGFAMLYDKRQDAIKEKSEKKDRKIDHVLNSIGIGLPVLVNGVLFVAGLNFEKNGVITSTFFRNLIGKMKISK